MKHFSTLQLVRSVVILSTSYLRVCYEASGCYGHVYKHVYIMTKTRGIYSSGCTKMTFLGCLRFQPASLIHVL
jgi:hypothetical protein